MSHSAQEQATPPGPTPATSDPVTQTIHAGQTIHRLVCGDGRALSYMPDESIHLVLTSPPYWTLKRYREHPAQLGHSEDYRQFLAELNKVWQQCYRVLVPRGRLICVVGDVCLSRRVHGRHLVVPLHADITVACRDIGFDNLSPIIWLKVSNATFEAKHVEQVPGQTL